MPPAAVFNATYFLLIVLHAASKINCDKLCAHSDNLIINYLSVFLSFVCERILYFRS